MSEQEGYSPSFKRPADILRICRKRTRSEGVGAAGRVAGSSPGVSVPGVRPFSPGPLFGSPKLSGGGVKRRNPFANVENTHSKPKRRAILSPGGDADHTERKPIIEAGEDGPSAPVPLGQLLTRAERADQKPLSLSDDDSVFDDLFSGEGRPSAAYPSGNAPAVNGATPPGDYPADWSLKTRLLIMSPLSFSWAEHLKAQEVALGLTQSCRATHCNLPAQIQEPRTSVELRCAFQQCLVYWQHPSLSWLPLFPRIGVEKKLSGKSMPWLQDEALQQSLMNDWSQSVTSLYSLVRARLCPYFYLCTYQFTVLFRAAGMSGTDGITAVLSSTTLGLREAMRAEGIEFTLPLLEEKKKIEDQGKHEYTEEPYTELKEQSEAEDDDDDASFSWLKEMGVQDQINKPDSVSIKLRKEHREVQLDRRPQSMVLVKGTDTFTLLNFFINYKNLVAASGVQAGLPPTLLAPVAFRGATLQTLKVRSVTVKTQVQNGYQDMFSLEVSGPVMPHTLHGLSQLLRIAQRGRFSVGLYTHEPTAVLNTSLGSPRMDTQQEKLAQELEACGLALSTVQQLAEPARLGRSVLRQLDMDDYSYSWRT
ncbi:protein downstream neighbor of son homolog isoform X2 [Paramormyrops kingsleyae]|uniref:protein downstream neighbor of son homolog isoform X2 n=1 Tax=Paramormyrops kingsleyae TaxID=1676925 RepID=UPI000CD5CB8A|nr:protein downstream neighbor of Son isoform X2 [Paramormyrops kingsleyae]